MPAGRDLRVLGGSGVAQVSTLGFSARGKDGFRVTRVSPDVIFDAEPCVVLYLFYGQQIMGTTECVFLGWFLGMTLVCFYIFMFS